MKLTHTQAVFMMVAVTLMWSIAGVITRHLEGARSFEITFWRSFFTAVSLLVILPLLQGPGVWRKLRQAGPPLWLSGVCWSVMFTAFMVALTLTSVANVLVTRPFKPEGEKGRQVAALRQCLTHHMDELQEGRYQPGWREIKDTSVTYGLPRMPMAGSKATASRP